MWVTVDRRNVADHASREPLSVIEVDDVLFVHHMNGQERLLRMTPAAGGGYVDNTTGTPWAGVLTADGQRIVGEWVGYDDWWASMIRTAHPAADALGGTFGSIAINRDFTEEVRAVVERGRRC